MKPDSRKKKSARARRDLFRATASRCKGKVLIAGRDSVDLAPVIRLGSEETTVIETAEDRLPGHGTFDTVVLSGFLEHAGTDVERSLAAAWNLLAPEGRLVVNVPNQDSLPDSGQTRWFDRKSLRKLLLALGKPRLAGDQPYAWLCMVVKKEREGKKRLNRIQRDRYRVTARLCRGKVIELGCGEGYLASFISKRGLEVVGVDHSAAKIRRALEIHPHIQFAEGDIRDLGLPDQGFDTVVLAEVLEHIPEGPGAAMLATAWRLLKPGGRLVVSVPNEDCVPHHNHVREFDRRSLKRLLRPLGRARTVTDQPYRWLLMTVEKAS
jgi:2-polyprenyl-3-methyl-5-hydroxy-6-metoxy-1,4-benzoquinol methylase